MSACECQACLDGREDCCMVPPTCGTCRWLGREYPLLWSGEGEDEPTGHRRCLRVIHGNDCSADETASRRNEPAAVVDGSGYAASLVVLPSFSCALWERAR